MAEAWIIDAVRTPRGLGKKGKGALSETHPQELLAQCLNALKDRNGFNPVDIDDVVIGCVSQAGEQGACPARMAVLAAGWPHQPTGVTLNRFCGSGQQAVNFAAMGVMAGQMDLVIGGGVESMSRCPMFSDGGGLGGENPHLYDLHPLVPQGISADLIATMENFSREDVDRFAVESQQKCKQALAEGRFKKSILPVHDLDGNLVLDHDEHPRPNTTLEILAKLEPSFAKIGTSREGGDLTLDEMAQRRYPQVSKINHVHTPGNSSGIVDGAATVLLATPEYARAHGLKPRARIRATATIGAEPVIMLTGPIPATEKCLKRAGMKISDIDLFEINEAFASVPLKVMRECDIEPAKVNVNGGSIALGHPLGATGAILLGTLVDELERSNKTTGLVTMCIGGGMGIATIVERI
ncbi:MAG TPA: acetyl-CoA C-acetyltransferase [Candidatus Binataceae bacterium]|nr:acetyl-CoA C-acetyltransferase [Candidatus Binataceae bacterium]